ncbi:MAG TPA: helix-turn-helix transcriptional regulator [Povalibacter sp.]
MDSTAMNTSVISALPQAAVGRLLRQWRDARRLSQLDLALDVGVSPRHLSFIETGKSRPSREMIARLADALHMPLRERNSLLLAAGYAPQYRETALTTPEMEPVRKAVQLILDHHEPFPAFVMNRHWDVMLTNRAMPKILGALKPGGPMHGNILRQVFDPQDMRPTLANWEEVARDLIRHVHAEVAAAPSDRKLRTLLDEVLAYPNVPGEWLTHELGSAPLPLITTVFAKGELKLRFFSTLTVFGTTRDVTINELRIECMFPADEITADFCRALRNL